MDSLGLSPGPPLTLKPWGGGQAHLLMTWDTSFASCSSRLILRPFGVQTAKRPTRKDSRVQLVDLTWEEAKRQLVRQETDLDTLHTRSLAVLSAAAISGGLFAGRLGSHRNSVQLAFMILALVCFALTAVAVVFIQWPHRDWAFAHDEVPVYLAEVMDKGSAARSVDFSYQMAKAFDQFRLKNHPKIECRYKAFTAACLLLALQVLFWGLTVAT